MDRPAHANLMVGCIYYARGVYSEEETPVGVSLEEETPVGVYFEEETPVGVYFEKRTPMALLSEKRNDQGVYLWAHACVVR